MNNIENFKKEFKIYCETVEDTKGLEVIKDAIFGDVLNLETFVDDYIDDNLGKRWFDINNEEQVSLARLISKELIKVSDEAEKVNNTKLRETYKLLNDLSYDEIKNKLEFVLNDLYWGLYRKKYSYNEDQFIDYEMHELEEKDLDKWYIDLVNLFEKYGL